MAGHWNRCVSGVNSPDRPHKGHSESQVAVSLSFNQRRLIGSVLFVPYAAIAANTIFELGFFGDYDRHVLGVATILMLAYVFRVGPTPTEMMEHRDRMDRERYGRPKDRKWQIVPITIVFMVFLLFAMGTGDRIFRGERLQEADWFTLIFIAIAGPFIAIYAWRIEKRWEDQRKNRR